MSSSAIRVIPKCTVSVDATPVLPPCGDKYKKGAPRGPRDGGRETLKGPLSYRGEFNKPECECGQV